MIWYDKSLWNSVIIVNKTFYSCVEKYEHGNNINVCESGQCMKWRCNIVIYITVIYYLH